MENNREPIKVAIIGVGNVGVATAYSLLVRGLAVEIVLVDSDQVKVQWEAIHLQNAAVVFPHPTRVRAGTYADCADATVTIISAGARPDVPDVESRPDLINQNGSILRRIIPEVANYAPNGILLIASSPVDVLTYLSSKLSGFPSNRVLGLGTILDTARFRYLLARRFDIDPESVCAYIIGEHGDGEVPVWSMVSAAGIPLHDLCEQKDGQNDKREMEAIFRETQLGDVGVTYYAVAAGLVHIIEAILRDENTILTVSTLAAHYGISDVCLSLPTKVNRKGADQIFHLPLNQEELNGLFKSAESVKAAISALNLGTQVAESRAKLNRKTTSVKTKRRNTQNVLKFRTDTSVSVREKLATPVDQWRSSR